jgi:cytidine diphosphoramidate kinase
MSKCYWITGLSAAGKTTISQLLVKYLRSKGENVILLDGDELRKVMSIDTYDRDDRVALGMSYARLCKLISSQGITVVIAVIGLFEEIQFWNRKNISEYIEIFIDTPLDELKKRDPKGIYKKFKEGDIINIAGLDLEVDYPSNPEVHLIWKRGISVELMFEELVSRIK